MIDFQIETGRVPKRVEDLDNIWARTGIIPRRAAAPGRLTAPLLPRPGDVCSTTDIHTRTAAIRMTLQTQIVIFWAEVQGCCVPI